MSPLRHFTLKRLLHPLRHTPLHPQWLVYLGEARIKRATAALIHGRVLDVGCGDGWLRSAVSPEVDYIGFDYPITVAKGYVADAADVLGCADVLPFDSNIFDTVALLDVLEHLARPEAALSEAYRVLRPGGRLIVHVPFIYPLHDVPHDFRRWTRMGLETLLETQGFEIRQCVYSGEPLETSAALGGIALARAILDRLYQPTWSVLLLPLLIPAIPVVNLLGWLLARLAPRNDCMPLGYRLIAEKTASTTPA